MERKEELNVAAVVGVLNALRRCAYNVNAPDFVMKLGEIMDLPLDADGDLERAEILDKLVITRDGRTQTTLWAGIVRMLDKLTDRRTNNLFAQWLIERDEAAGNKRCAALYAPRSPAGVAARFHVEHRTESQAMAIAKKLCAERGWIPIQDRTEGIPS